MKFLLLSPDRVGALVLLEVVLGPSSRTGLDRSFGLVASGPISGGFIESLDPLSDPSLSINVDVRMVRKRLLLPSRGVFAPVRAEVWGCILWSRTCVGPFHEATGILASEIGDYCPVGRPRPWASNTLGWTDWSWTFLPHYIFSYRTDRLIVKFDVASTISCHGELKRQV